MSNSGNGGNRSLTVRVKTARKRKLSSTLWLQRQLNDPYVARAKKDGYRGRAAYKLIDLDDKFKLLKQGMRVLDLGAAPGGWTQVAVQRCGAGNVLGVDLKEIEPIPGAMLMVQDFMEDSAPARIREALGGKVHAVISDMAPNASGQPSIDHLRIIGLCEAALEFAVEMLEPGGIFVAKVWQGGSQPELLKLLRQHFEKVRHAKPESSRKNSAESFVVATGFRRAEA
jgi:23S rRNA (uridine2552-2'-O)-methyltransferase